MPLPPLLAEIFLFRGRVAGVPLFDCGERRHGVVAWKTGASHRMSGSAMVSGQSDRGLMSAASIGDRLSSGTTV